MAVLKISQLPAAFRVLKWKPAATPKIWSQLLSLTEPTAPLSLFSLSVTHAECSLVASANAPVPNAGPEFPVEIEDGYAAFMIHGPLDFSLVGILASLTSALAEQSISVFAVSTYDTDYILVKEEKAEAAVKAWESLTGNYQVKLV
ncbi:hypothetical protein HDU83_003289 [Entophlyctis luteolus]|nr:hypothetical protein HDU83_003289 [Entophlyctis luteolus]KAJ3382220.1 hypothetical protein HDU84_004423 [Entophlyctis sp. JEL0112]